MLLPSWWAQKRRLGLRVKAASRRGATVAGGVGMDALVSFEWKAALGDHLDASRAPPVGGRGRGQAFARAGGASGWSCTRRISRRSARISAGVGRLEDQATDRAYRIGQRCTVFVHKLVCAGTVEERIDAMISAKRALAEQVVGTGEGWIIEMSTKELREVIALRADAVED